MVKNSGGAYLFFAVFSNSDLIGMYVPHTSKINDTHSSSNSEKTLQNLLYSQLGIPDRIFLGVR